MGTTLTFDDALIARLRDEAARRGTTLSELAESALRRLVEPTNGSTTLPPLPTFDGGEPRVDVAQRDALVEAMEGL